MKFADLNHDLITEIIKASEAVDDAFPRSEEREPPSLTEFHDVSLEKSNSPEQKRLVALLDDLTKAALDELEALMLYGRADTEDTFREILRSTHGPEQRDAQIGYILGKQGSLTQYLQTGVRRLNETGETIGPRSFAELAEDEQAHVLELYYRTDTAVQAIIDQFDLDCAPGRLSKQFPPAVTDEECPYCNVPLVKRRPSRTRSDFRTYAPFCEDCGHGKRTPCRCANCKATRDKAARLDHDAKYALIAQAFAYQEIDTPIVLESLRDAVALLSLSKHSLDGDYLGSQPKLHEPIPYSPNPQMTEDLVMALYRRHLLQVSHESPFEAFVFDRADWINEFFPMSCDWLLLPANQIANRRELIEDCQSILSSGVWPAEWESEIDILWNAIALGECEAHLEALLRERNLEFEEREPKTTDVLKRALLSFAPAQVINLCWQSARDAVDFMAKKEIPRRTGQDVVRGILDRKIDKYLVNNWKLNPSRRDRRLPRSAVSVVFFDIVTGFGNEYFQEIPPQPVAP